MTERGDMRRIMMAGTTTVARGSGPEKFTFPARNMVTNERCTTSVRA